MLAAPFSWAAGTNLAPAASSALVTRKLPLPTTPNTVRTPHPASARPTACATITRRSGSSFDERQHAARAAGAADDRQRAGDHHRAGGRQGAEVAQLGQPVLVVAEQEAVARERRLERVGGAGVGADGLHADPLDRGFL